MNSDASHFLFFSFDEGAKGEGHLRETESSDIDELEDDEEGLEDDEDEDPFEINTTNPWEYDDQDNF